MAFVAAVHQIDELDNFFLLFQFDEFGLDRNINQNLAAKNGALDFWVHHELHPRLISSAETSD